MRAIGLALLASGAVASAMIPGIAAVQPLDVERELGALQKCQRGDCGLRLGEQAIASFRTGLAWTAADAGREANLVARRLMLGYAEAYLRGGDEGLGATYDEKKPRLVAEDFRELIRVPRT